MSEVIRRGLKNIYRMLNRPERIDSYAHSETAYNMWPAYNSSSVEYNRIFQPVFAEGDSLQTIVSRNLSKYGRCIGIDLCGQGDFLSELGVTRGLSICLQHDYSRCEHGSVTLQKFDGDLMDNKTWNKADRWIKTNGHPNLIVCAPGGGAESLWDWGPTKPNDPEIHTYARTTFLQHTLKMFSWLSNGGSMFVEFCNSESIPAWMEYMGPKLFEKSIQKADISVNTKYRVLRITKDTTLLNNKIKFSQRFYDTQPVI